MSFALKLKSLREEKGLTQAQLAKELNVGIGSIGMWESTQRTPPAKKLKNIAEYFGVTIDYFFAENDEQIADEYFKKNSMNIPQLANRLREVRINNGLSQGEISRVLGISTSSIRDYELGWKEPSTYTLWKYCESFGVSADYLIGVIDTVNLNNHDLTHEEELLIKDYRNLPDSIKNKGVSVDYLLGLEDDFGAKVAAPMGDTLTAKERELLETFRELSSYLQGLTLDTVRSFAGKNKDGLHKKA